MAVDSGTSAVASGVGVGSPSGRSAGIVPGAGVAEIAGACASAPAPKPVAKIPVPSRPIPSTRLERAERRRRPGAGLAAGALFRSTAIGLTGDRC
ncbi:hypothetical protein [Candidatus Solirubrobacter pratensis]|uniref:hypothetical protein n=1 Tax=Candidatus Solirubrobacter pratensis TaxID=1298857 RepID=UPI0012DC8ECD|nr:hypothetical protein [Candidatus Solirubrobacter pratensis]